MKELKSYDGFVEKVACCSSCKFYTYYWEEEVSSCSCPENKGKFSDIQHCSICSYYEKEA